MNFAYCNGFELHYRDIEPCIIIEEYLENRSGELPDYKISCFGGKPELIQYINRRPEGLQIAVYDTGWRKTDIAFGRKEINADIPRPECLEELLKAAEKLSAPFSFVRVDMYVLDSGEIKFGEMTFTPASGVHRWSDMQHDEMLGKMIKLPEKYYLPGIDYRFDR
ncbi:MAG: hypothetical protein IKF68_08570, partial [Erysipelotrichaceae bacterium]|nr:hypothetical protein [Erysipelotrichaceae bacterium]